MSGLESSMCVWKLAMGGLELTASLRSDQLWKGTFSRKDSNQVLRTYLGVCHTETSLEPRKVEHFAAHAASWLMIWEEHTEMCQYRHLPALYDKECISLVLPVGVYEKRVPDRGEPPSTCRHAAS